MNYCPLCMEISALQTGNLFSEEAKGKNMPPKREKQLQFRVSEDESQQFRDAADLIDMGVSDCLRKAAKLGIAQMLSCPELRSLELEYVPGSKENQ